MIFDYIIYTDGAARGVNGKGPAASAFVVFQEDGTKVYEHAETLGPATNNYAEYHALARAVEYVVNKTLPHQRELSVLVRTDSQLMARQLNGQYKVNNPAIALKFAECKHYLCQFKAAVIEWIPRERNTEADGLCNKVLDAQKEHGGLAVEWDGGLGIR